MTQGAPGMSLVRIASASATGELWQQGAQVNAWQPLGSEPVLWCSEQAIFAAGASIRGGIPLCAPWFAFGRSENMDPLHGFFQYLPWRLVEASSRGHGAEQVSELALEVSGADASGFPGAADYPVGFHSRLVVSMGRDLELTWSVTAGEEDLELEQAMHTHFAVGDIRQLRIHGLSGSTYLDKVLNPAPSVQQVGPVTFERETDRVYVSAGTVTLVDPVLDRIITVAKSGSANSVVWNPWADKAIGMNDFGDDEWTGMVCVETANVLENAVPIPAGGTHTMSLRLSVQPYRPAAEALRAAGATGAIHTFDQPVPTARAAADTLGCSVAAIANSLIFDSGGTPILVIASGAARVDPKLIATALDVPPLRRASAEFVLTHTGQVVGGVCPVGHPQPIRTVVDVSLAEHEQVWAGAGDEHSMVATTFAELVAITGGTAMQVR